MAKTHALTVVLTRDVADRYRGFLASVLAEVAPGVYIAANLTAGIRDRTWTVLQDWWTAAPGGSLLMVFADRHAPSGMSVRTLGTPAIALVEVDGLHLAHFTVKPSGTD